MRLVLGQIVHASVAEAGLWYADMVEEGGQGADVKNSSCSTVFVVEYSVQARAHFGMVEEEDQEVHVKNSSWSIVLACSEVSLATHPPCAGCGCSEHFRGFVCHQRHLYIAPSEMAGQAGIALALLLDAHVVLVVQSAGPTQCFRSH